MDSIGPNVELSAPTWIDNAFFEKVLKSEESDHNIKVVHSEIKPATAPGDNYGSDMYRATVQIQRGTQTEEISLIIKTERPITTSDTTKVSQKPSPIFGTEINVFSIVHPAMYDILDKHSIGNNQPFAAKYTYSELEYGRTVIVLEDLKKQGFILADRTLGLDMKHCLLVMRTIARYHAASIVLNQNNPDILKLFPENIYTGESSKYLEPLFAGNVRTCAKEVATWPGYKERYADKLNKLADTAMDEWVRAMKPDEGSFNVLIHGDLCTNNMMFRYSEETGEVMDVRFVDFQLSLWTSAATDIQYFLNLSASPEVLENIKEVIEEYHNTLCNILTLLGYGHLQPTLKQLNEDIEKRGRFGVIASVAFRIIGLADSNNIPDIEKFLINKEEMHLSETYKASMKTFLPLYESKGWI